MLALENGQAGAAAVLATPTQQGPSVPALRQQALLPDAQPLAVPPLPAPPGQVGWAAAKQVG